MFQLSSVPPLKDGCRPPPFPCGFWVLWWVLGPVLGPILSSMRSHGAVVLPLVVQQVHISANSRCVLTHAGRRAHYQHTHGSAMSYTVPQPQGSTEL